MAINSTRTKAAQAEKNRRREDAGALAQLWLSPWTRWVGARYLKSKKNSRFLSFITILSIFGVGLGVTAMIVVLSVMDGFEAEIKKRLMVTDLHVLVTPLPEVPGFDQGLVPARALDGLNIVETLKADPQVESFSPVLTTEAIFKSGKKVTGVVVKGITDERLNRLKAHLTESIDPQLLSRREGAEATRLSGVFIGQELAYELGSIPGDQISLISPTQSEGPAGSVPRLRRYVIEGVYHSGLPEQELHTIFASDQTVRAFLRKAEVVSQWEITMKDFEKAPEFAGRLRRLAPLFRVQDWMQLNAHLFASLKLERLAMFVILTFIIIVASFNIITTLTLMVIEKKKEISILKAMGARHSQVAAIFLSEGLLIGGLGIGGGGVLAFLLCSVLKRYEFITLPDIYYDRTLPVTLNWAYYAGVGVCAFLIVLGACLYPSRRAARLNPLDGIRFG